MIFVTVGAQMPFDRLVRALDGWAKRHGRQDVFAQIGPGDYRPSAMQWTRFLAPAEFGRRCDAAALIVAHAGTGSIIAALQRAKPIVVMPRRAALRETRNDHQVATARKLGRPGAVLVAWDERELEPRLQEAEHAGATRAALGAHASPELIAALRAFIDGEPAPSASAPDDDPAWTRQEEQATGESR